MPPGLTLTCGSPRVKAAGDVVIRPLGNGVGLLADVLVSTNFLGQA